MKLCHQHIWNLTSATFDDSYLFFRILFFQICFHAVFFRLTDTTTHRCRSKQIFGSAKNFCPNVPKLAWKVVLQLVPYKFALTENVKTCTWCDFQKRYSFVFLQALGAIFCLNFQGFCPDLRKLKLLGVRLNPVSTTATKNCLANKRKFQFSVKDQIFCALVLWHRTMRWPVFAWRRQLHPGTMGVLMIFSRRGHHGIFPNFF